MKKYKFTGEEKNGLMQIVAIQDFGLVMSGDIGGWIEKENNLSQSGNAWVSGDARVSGNARVYGDAYITKSPITISNMGEFYITIYNNFIQVGCKLHTFDEWNEIITTGKYIDLCSSTKSYNKLCNIFEFIIGSVER